MKDSKASHHLREICENYEKQAAELKNLRRRVSTLTRQRDQANARNAELRQHIAKYQADIAAMAQTRRDRPSAWEFGGRIHTMGAA